MDLAAIQQIAVASSAVVATLTYVYKVFDDKRSRDAKDLFERQKAVAHHVSDAPPAERNSLESLAETLRTGVPNASGKTIAEGLRASTTPKKISVSLAAERITDRKTASRFPLLTFKRANGFILRNSDDAPTPSAPSHDEQMRHAASHETQELLQRIAELRAKSEERKP